MALGKALDPFEVIEIGPWQEPTSSLAGFFYMIITFIIRSWRRALKFQEFFPSACDVAALEPEELGVRMLPVLVGWEEGYIFSLSELLARVAGDGRNAFPLANYPAEKRQKVRDALEDAWRCLERQGWIEPNPNGGSTSRLSRDARKYALAPDKAFIVIRNGNIKLLQPTTVGVAALIGKTSLLGFDTVEQEIVRALASVKDDPEDAVTSACSLIEAVCRSILIELSIPLPAKKDINGLIRAVQEPLGLSPGRTDLQSEIEADVRQILGGLTSVAKGIGALRTHGGDAHGREKGYRRLDARMRATFDQFCGLFGDVPHRDMGAKAATGVAASAGT